MLNTGSVVRDVEIDRRAYGNYTIVLLEDRHSSMMNSDGTSRQYILAVERTAACSGNIKFTHKRFISNLMKKQRFASAKEAARAIFNQPEKFKGILGEDWIPFANLPPQEENAVAAAMAPPKRGLNPARYATKFRRSKRKRS